MPAAKCRIHGGRASPSFSRLSVTAGEETGCHQRVVQRFSFFKIHQRDFACCSLPLNRAQQFRRLDQRRVGRHCDFEFSGRRLLHVGAEILNQIFGVVVG